MADELKDVGRIGPPLPRMLVPCPSCGGMGTIESGFAFGSNVSHGYTCPQCHGRCSVEIEAPLAVIA